MLVTHSAPDVSTSNDPSPPDANGVPSELATTKFCKLSLFTWTSVEKDGRTDVTPQCPQHPSSKTRFAPFAGGILVSCAAGDHPVMLWQQPQFNAELEQARPKLGLNP